MPTKKHGEEHDVPQSDLPVGLADSKPAGDAGKIVPGPVVGPVLGSSMSADLVTQLKNALDGEGSDKDKLAAIKIIVDAVPAGAGGVAVLQPPDPNADRDPESGNPYH